MKTPNRNGAFLLVALGIGAQIPLTIDKIPDPTVRALLMLLAVLVCIYASAKIDPRRGFSDPPPRMPEGSIPELEVIHIKEPDTIPDRPARK